MNKKQKEFVLGVLKEARHPLEAPNLDTPQAVLKEFDFLSHCSYGLTKERAQEILHVELQEIIKDKEYCSFVGWLNRLYQRAL